jgi:NADPH:quinone reductase-like Zn-dependent oxidoreductase
LEQKEIPKAENPTDIVIKIKAAGLNPVDWKMCSRVIPRALGIDGCG